MLKHDIQSTIKNEMETIRDVAKIVSDGTSDASYWGVARGCGLSEMHEIRDRVNLCIKLAERMHKGK